MKIEARGYGKLVVRLGYSDAVFGENRANCQFGLHFSENLGKALNF
jgi:hypothetical protein